MKDEPSISRKLLISTSPHGIILQVLLEFTELLNLHIYMCPKVKSLSRVRLFATP